MLRLTTMVAVAMMTPVLLLSVMLTTAATRASSLAPSSSAFPLSWLARSLTIECPNDGPAAMRRLRRDFDAVDPADRSAAMAMVSKSVIPENADVSAEHLQRQHDHIRRYAMDIVRASGPDYDDSCPSSSVSLTMPFLAPMTLSANWFVTKHM